jgi:hypothetical protein
MKKWEHDLTKDIRWPDGQNNDDDGNQAKRIIRDHVHNFPHAEFTECNRNSLTDEFLKIKDKCRTIVEIGVCRNGNASSTWCFLNNKKDETIYVGIDLNDKTFLNNTEKNIHTIRGTSSNVDSNIETLRGLGVNEIDFLFIDGFHSINQVLIDWEYSQILSEFGIIGFHDTAEHPGPHLFMKALNKDKWDVQENVCPYDHGVGFARRK